MIDGRGAAAVALGAATGAGARWCVVEVVPASDGWPWAIFVVNVVGSFLLGQVLAITHHRTDESTSDPIRLAIGTGFCGALTTFATFAVDVAELMRDGRAESGIGYLGASVGIGVVAFVAGRTAGRWQAA